MASKDHPKIICIRCAKEKPRKEFQRGSKEYKSCNECAFATNKLIDEGFKKSFELLNEKI